MRRGEGLPDGRCRKCEHLCFITVYLATVWFTIDKPGDVSYEMILTESSIMLVGVGGDANDAGMLSPSDMGMVCRASLAA